MSGVTMNNNNWTNFGTIERFKDMKCDSIDNPMALLEFKKRKLPEKRQWDFQKGIAVYWCIHKMRKNFELSKSLYSEKYCK